MTKWAVLKYLMRYPAECWEKLEFLVRTPGVSEWIKHENKIAHWLENSRQIETWIANAATIDSWMKHQAVVTAAVHAQIKKLEYPEFVRDFGEFVALSKKSGRQFAVPENDLLPCLEDRTEETGFDRHYLYHPAWAARVLAQTRPETHTDISSILSFSMVLSAFVPVNFFDIRPAAVKMSNLESHPADLLALPFANDSIKSLSCMHVLEHVGLGRYGDKLDPMGDVKAIQELVRVLAPGGDLLVATPVGRQRIQFNAHRIYDHLSFCSLFKGLELIEFSLIPDGTVAEGMIKSPPEEFVRSQNYACGCFWFKKPMGSPAVAPVGSHNEG